VLDKTDSSLKVVGLKTRKALGLAVLGGLREEKNEGLVGGTCLGHHWAASYLSVSVA